MFLEAIAFFYGPRGRLSLFKLFNDLLRNGGTNSITCEPYFTNDANKLVVLEFIKGIDSIAPTVLLLEAMNVLPPLQHLS